MCKGPGGEGCEGEGRMVLRVPPCLSPAGEQLQEVDGEGSESKGRESEGWDALLG